MFRCVPEFGLGHFSRSFRMNEKVHGGRWWLLPVLAGLILPAMMVGKAPEGKDKPAIADGGKAAQAKPAPAPAPIKPKALSTNVEKGLAFLAKQQLKDGGWGQGDESAAIGGGREMKDKSNVADTCMATLVFLRAGPTPGKGIYADNVAKAVAFVCTSVEKSDKDSLSVTSIQGTRVQGKIGQYVDTFLAALLL